MVDRTTNEVGSGFNSPILPVLARCSTVGSEEEYKAVDVAIPMTGHAVAASAPTFIAAPPRTAIAGRRTVRGSGRRGASRPRAVASAAAAARANFGIVTKSW